MRMSWCVVVAALVSVLGGCSAQDSAEQGDCSATVRLGGEIYRPASTVLMPRAGRPLPSSDYYGCGGEGRVPESGKAELHVAVGLDPDSAVLVRERGEDFVYVRQSMRVRDWPAKLKVASRFPRCRVPASFTGTWTGVDPEDMPGEDYDVAVPYTGTFQARRGTGPRLDQWASVMVQARITGATRPVPTARFLERALADQQAVLVTTECRGNTFVVSSITFAAG